MDPGSCMGWHIKCPAPNPTPIRDILRSSRATGHLVRGRLVGRSTPESQLTLRQITRQDKKCSSELRTSTQARARYSAGHGESATATVIGGSLSISGSRCAQKAAACRLGSRALRASASRSCVRTAAHERGHDG
eukprot:2272488-Prymnesium_polylepis.1